MAATLKLDTITNASNATGNNNIELDAYSNVKINGATLSPAASSSNTGNLALTGSLAMGSSFKRNKIINGDMRVDQRNSGASGTANGYTVDRFGYYGSQSSKITWQQNAGSVTPPSGFTNYLGFTSSSSYSVTSTDTFQFYQCIEGLNINDLGWGTANAKTVTISFWVYSSLTGTHSGVLLNSAQTWSYPFTFTISSANTWEQKSVTIVGPNASQGSGTWLTTNGTGIQVLFNLGAGTSRSGSAGSWTNSALFGVTGAVSVVGTNGATFYITGVQLEVGSIATPYERQIYSNQLIECMRYYYRTTGGSGGYAFLGTGRTINATYGDVVYVLPTTMRATPSLGYSSLSHLQTNYGTLNTFSIETTNTSTNLVNSLALYVGPGSATVGLVQILQFQNSSGWVDFSAEL